MGFSRVGHMSPVRSLAHTCESPCLFEAMDGRQFGIGRCYDPTGAAPSIRAFMFPLRTAVAGDEIGNLDLFKIPSFPGGGPLPEHSRAHGRAQAHKGEIQGQKDKKILSLNNVLSPKRTALAQKVAQGVSVAIWMIRLFDQEGCIGLPLIRKGYVHDER